MPSKVLIVDDDKTTREGLAEFLEEAGYEAVAVGTFEEATRVLRTTPPDLLIADVHLRAVQRPPTRHQQPEADPGDHHHGLRGPGAGIRCA